ncbi:uncharacterized protein LOC130997833 [Salvia miltiorrhiza]|uniref:uncharacterized protein LOC130997833 n=1 Tax=Salvia miltiorrhiza TaxID=226208 RepID=UPI0025AB9682|nr:uncharacterized protein LOC130997833 [Salvia miltiorrhiza]
MSWRSKCRATLLSDRPSGDEGQGSEQPADPGLDISRMVIDAPEETTPVQRFPPGKGKNMEVLTLFSPDSQGAGGSGSGGAGRESAIPVVDVDDDLSISALVRDIPTPASRQIQQKRKAAVQALAEKRRKKDPSKADRLVDPEVGSAGGAEAASVDAEGSKVPALPAGESGASGSRPISSLKGRHFVRTLLSHIHPKDRETTGKLKRATLANQLSQLALQLESRVGEAIQCIDDYDAVEKDLEKEKERTASRDEEVAGMVEQYSKAEADVAELKAKLAQAEVEKASLASELERAKKEGYDNIVRFRMRYLEEHRESRRN